MAIFVRRLKRDAKREIYSISVPIPIVRAMGLEQGDLLDIEDIDNLIVLKKHEPFDREK